MSVFKESFDLIRTCWCSIAPGLSTKELQRIESHFDIIIPPDYKEFLSEWLPLWKNFVDWRYKDISLFQPLFDWPIESILFNVKMDNYWHSNFWIQSDSLQENQNIARQYLESLPKLMPIYWHRYIPTFPLRSGNPIISVYWIDTIYYWSDLKAYIENEFDESESDKKHVQSNALSAAYTDIVFRSELELGE